MKRFWWSLVIFLVCLTYLTVGNSARIAALTYLTVGNSSKILVPGMRNTSIEDSVHNEPNQRINIGGYYTGSNARLRPTNTTSEAKTLYEQARTNLAAR